MTASIVEGLLESSFVVCLALAYGLLYGTLRVMDLTVSARATAAAYGGWWLASVLVHEGNPAVSPLVWVGATIASLAVTVPTWRLLVPLSKSAPLVMLVGSLGLSILLQAIYQFAFGAAPRVFERYPVEEGIGFLGTTATALQLIAAGYALFATIIVAATFQLTKFGNQLKAVAQDAEVAQCVFGVDLRRLSWMAVLLASTIIAPAALLYCIGHGVAPVSGLQQGLLAFVASIVAGRERPLGAALIALVLVVAGTLAVKTGLAELSAFALVVAGATYVLARSKPDAPPLLQVGITAAIVLLTAGFVPRLFQAVVQPEITQVRLPSTFQPLVPYALVVIALLWRPRGVLARPSERAV